MKSFNKIMRNLNNTVEKLELLSAKICLEKEEKQNIIRKIKQDIENISAEEMAATEVAKKLKVLFTPVTI